MGRIQNILCVDALPHSIDGFRWPPSVGLTIHLHYIGVPLGKRWGDIGRGGTSTYLPQTLSPKVSKNPRLELVLLPLHIKASAALHSNCSFSQKSKVAFSHRVMD